MDGLLIKYDQAFEAIGNLYFRGGVFLIDDRVDHYGYVGEVGIYNFIGTGAYFKYSFIDWDTKRLKTEIERRRFRFFNSQATLGYKFTPKSLNKIVILYSSYLHNHRAEGNEITNYKKMNDAFYFGFSIGELRKKNDWSLDCNYQYVKPQAVADYDCSGIGRGNIQRVGLYSINKNGTGGKTNRRNAVGSANYKGVSFQFLYMLTDNITIQQNWQQSTNQTKEVGPFFRYKQYEMEIIYGF